MAPVAAGGEAKPEPPRVTATLPAPAAAASAAFGLTEIAPPPGAGEAMLDGLARLTRDRRAFGRVALLGAIIEDAGRTIDGLVWQRISLEGEQPWGAGGVAAGDLLRVGDRVVVLYRDASPAADAATPIRPTAPPAPPASTGIPGALDRTDLCFDYVHGAAVRALGAVFAESKGEGGQVEWASLRQGSLP